MKRLGIMGGSFDPIHNGHLHAAEQTKEVFGLEEVLFVPAYCPPHKSVDDLAPAVHRFEMAKLAVRDVPGFKASPVEFERACYTYAGDTINAIKEEYDVGWEFYFITGLDAILTIINWDKARTYPGISAFIAVVRPGYDLDRIKKELPAEFRPHVLFLQIKGISVSSTEIRDRVRSGMPISGLVPEAVKEYIEVQNLYRDQ